MQHPIRLLYNAFLVTIGGGLLVIATLATIVGAWSALAPVPKSPQLATSGGVVLDEEAQAQLTAVVFQAAREDDAETIRAYLDEGFTPNVRSPRGDTLLTVAAYYDSTQIVTALLAHTDTDLEARNRMGLTAVSAAAFKGHEQSLRQLLDAGADPEGANSLGQTALMFASLAGRTNAVQMLQEAGANANREDHSGHTAEDLARQQGAQAVEQMLASGQREPLTSDAPVPLELQ